MISFSLFHFNYLRRVALLQRLVFKGPPFKVLQYKIKKLLKAIKIHDVKYKVL